MRSSPQFRRRRTLAALLLRSMPALVPGLLPAQARSVSTQRPTVAAADTTLWALIVETMLLDTRKHLAMLRFVKRQAGR